MHGLGTYGTQTILLRSWMKLLMNLAQTISANVGVDFRGADIRVPEQFLDHA